MRSESTIARDTAAAAVISSLTVHWPSLILGPAAPGRDSVLGFSVRLLCLGALVETLLSFDRVLMSSRAFDPAAAGYPPLPMLSAIERESQQWKDLYDLHGHVAALNDRIYGAIDDDAWYDTIQATSDPEGAEAWRDIVATELAAAMTFAAETQSVLVLNSLEASLFQRVREVQWTAFEGVCHFEDVLTRSPSRQDIIDTAIQSRDAGAVAEWRRRLQDVISGASTPRASDMRPWILARQMADSRPVALLRPFRWTHYARVEALFGVPAADTELQVAEIERRWRIASS